jgi:hypothetical protein
MLHGTSVDVGDFQIVGNARVQSTGNETEISYSFKYTWNDIIDPEPSYPGDVVSSWVLRLFYDPADYEAHISWNDKSCRVKKCGNTISSEHGYSFEH